MRAMWMVTILLLLLFVQFQIGRASSCDEKSRIIIMYDDQTKIDVSGDHDFNCDPRASYSISYDDAETYLKKNISKIRVYTKNGYVEEKLTPDQAREFRIVLKHLSQAVK